MFALYKTSNDLLIVASCSALSSDLRDSIKCRLKQNSRGGCLWRNQGSLSPLKAMTLKCKDYGLTAKHI